MTPAIGWINGEFIRLFWRSMTMRAVFGSSVVSGIGFFSARVI
jgi:hypothetical protein